MSTDLEDRVRRALSARAGQITPGSLQPAVPPTAAAPARRSWRPRWRSLLVVAAVVVAVVFSVRRPAGDPPLPVPNAPAATVPSPSFAPSPSPTSVSEPVPSTVGISDSPPPPSATTAPSASPKRGGPDTEAPTPARTP